MFQITILELITAFTSVVSAVFVLFFINETFENIDKSLTKLKNENKILEKTVEQLESENKNFKTSNQPEEIKISNSNRNGISENEIKEILIKENRKLHIRCDMLEEEIKKMREKDNDILIMPSSHIKFL
jgi:cell division protein FtsB